RGVDLKKKTMSVDVVKNGGSTSGNDAINYVNKWLPESNSRFYMNNREIRAMINGDGGTRSYVDDLSQIFFEHTPGIPFDVPTIKQILLNYADGSTDNDEFYTGFDPFGYTFNESPNNIVKLYSDQCGGTCSTNFKMDNEGMLQMYEIIKGIDRNNIPIDGFFKNYVRANPQLYGGPAGGSVDLSFNPTWLTQDPN
ncbi:MAG: hypothetical protein ACWA5R_07550, partial [bacterium]